MGVEKRILEAYLNKSINNKTKKYSYILEEIEKYDKSDIGFAYLTNYNNRRIVEHGGLANIGYPAPEFQDIRNVCTNKFSNTYAHELDKASLILTAKRKYLQECKFVTKKIIQSPCPHLAYNILRISELIQFEGSNEIYFYNVGEILDVIPSNIIIPQLGYFVDPHGNVLINESIVTNQTSMKNSIRRLFKEDQREIFLLIISKAGDIKLANKSAIAQSFLPDDSVFTHLKSKIKIRLNKLLSSGEEEISNVSLEYFLDLYGYVLIEEKLKSVFAFGRIDS